MPCNRATARNDREKIAQYIGELVQKTVISSILCRKTSTENCHSMLRKPVRSFPLLLIRNTSDSENKAYNGEK